jgi:hypothetical protein
MSRISSLLFMYLYEDFKCKLTNKLLYNIGVQLREVITQGPPTNQCVFVTLSFHCRGSLSPHTFEQQMLHLIGQRMIIKWNITTMHTNIFVCYMTRLVVKIIHQENVRYDDVGLCAQNKDCIITSWVVNP